jgi:hypothetical protein
MDIDLFYNVYVPTIKYDSSEEQQATIFYLKLVQTRTFLLLLIIIILELNLEMIMKMEISSSMITMFTQMLLITWNSDIGRSKWPKS